MPWCQACDLSLRSLSKQPPMQHQQKLHDCSHASADCLGCCFHCGEPAQEQRTQSMLSPCLHVLLKASRSLAGVILCEGLALPVIR